MKGRGQGHIEHRKNAPTSTAAEGSPSAPACTPECSNSKCTRRRALRAPHLVQATAAQLRAHRELHLLDTNSAGVSTGQATRRQRSERAPHHGHETAHRARTWPKSTVGTADSAAAAMRFVKSRAAAEKVRTPSLEPHKWGVFRAERPASVAHGMHKPWESGGSRQLAHRPQNRLKAVRSCGASL